MSVGKLLLGWIASVVLSIAVIVFLSTVVTQWIEPESDLGQLEQAGDEPEEELMSAEELAYREAIRVYSEEKYAEAMLMFEALGEYRESANYYLACQSALEAEKQAKEIEEKYNNALSLITEEDYERAIPILRELGDYKDCAIQIAKITQILESKAIELAGVGNYTGACEALAPLGYNAQSNSLYRAYTYAMEGNFASAVQSGLTVVVFPEGTESIPNNYFRDDSHANALQKVVLPTSLESIGNYAFYGCAKLTEISFANGLNAIGKSAFEGCITLKKIDLPSGLLTIGDAAFASSGLEAIAFPGSLQTIGQGAFSNCDSIANIALPQSLISLGESAFAGCDNLLTVAVTGNVKTISKQAFSNCQKLESVTIGDGVETLGIDAFKGCSKLTSVILPQTLQKIEDNAFYQCSSLSTITIPATVTRIGANVFAACGALKSVYFDCTEKWTDGVRTLDLSNAQRNASRLTSSINTIWSRKVT